MNLLSKIKQVAKIGLVFGVFAAAVSGVNLVADQITPASAATTCDPINVLVCGLTGGSTSAEITTLKTAYDNNISSSSSVSYSFHDIKTIFNYVGANQSLVDGMTLSNTAVVTVYKNGDVKDSNGKLIATNAMSVGRFNTPSGSTLIPGTAGAYYRSTTQSFVSSSLQAIVRLDSKGDMIFGAIIDCGNAFTATPVARPSFDITKSVSHYGSAALYKSISVNPGDHVTYTITATNTGNRAISGVWVKDVLPANDTYVSGTLTRNGSPVAVGFFGVGDYIGTLNVGATDTYSFDAIVGANDTVTSCTNETLHNEAILTGSNMIALNDYANVSKVCLPVPVAPTNPAAPNYQCSSLSYTQIGSRSYLYNAQALATNGATIKSFNFNFGDGTSQVVTSSLASTSYPHDFGSAGTFTANVTVTFGIPNAADATVSSANCSSTIVIAGVAAPIPSAICTNIGVVQSSAYSRNVTATVTYSAVNGASLTGVNFTWGDGSTTNNGVNTSYTHQYSSNGTYNVIATLSFNAGSTSLPNSSCQASISVNVTPPPVVVPPTPAAPAAVCTNLSLVQSTSNLRNVTATTTYSAVNGAILSNVSFNWGDNNTVSNGLVQSASHVYQGNGTFTVIATLSFTAGGSSLPNSACQATLTFNTTTPPVVAPAVLVNTGPGSIAAMFAAFTAIGTLGYRVFLSRRLTQ